MTIITAEDDYQVVTIESKSEASTLDELIDIFRGVAVALGYDPEQVAERLPTQFELDERGVNNIEDLNKLWEEFNL
tara:strand:+ start:373 stop:600 length:228 start_codon:yes stop_codon:yes gene_type:complete